MFYIFIKLITLKQHYTDTHKTQKLQYKTTKANRLLFRYAQQSL